MLIENDCTKKAGRLLIIHERTSPEQLHNISIKRRLITHSEQLLLTVLLLRLSLTNMLPPLVERSMSETQRQRHEDSCRQNPQAETVAEPVVG